MKLKIHKEHYEDVLRNNKRFEVRSTKDRTFYVDQHITLCEVDNASFTGRELEIIVTYVLDNEDYCKKGFCIFSFSIKEPNTYQWEDEHDEDEWERLFLKKDSDKFESI